MVEHTTMTNASFSTKEMQPQSEWGRFVRAFQEFKGDYAIVHHEGTPYFSPLDAPNAPDQEGNRQYSVSQIPDDMTEDRFLQELAEVNTLFVGCMDKDAIRPMYDQLKERVDGKIMTIAMAGGVVQHTEERVLALETILTYIAQRGANISHVIVSGHNHDCGLVKVASNGEPLSKNLGVAPASDDENSAMKRLIKAGVSQFKIQDMFPNATVQEGLVSIDRKGGAHFDTTGFESIVPLSIHELAERFA